MWLKISSSYPDNIWSADIVDMQLMLKYKKGVKFLHCAIDICSKHAWFFPLKDKKVITITNALQKIFDKSKLKPNKIWARQGSELYNRSMGSCFHGNGIEMYSKYNQGKFVVTERFVRALKSKIYKHMTAVSKSVYIDARNETVDKYNKTYYGTIKMNSGDVKLDNDIDYGVGHSDENPKFKIGEYQIGLKK